jgi:hypothetical protein
LISVLWARVRGLDVVVVVIVACVVVEEAVAALQVTTGVNIFSDFLPIAGSKNCPFSKKQCCDPFCLNFEL